METVFSDSECPEAELLGADITMAEKLLGVKHSMCHRNFEFPLFLTSNLSFLQTNL